MIWAIGSTTLHSIEYSLSGSQAHAVHCAVEETTACTCETPCGDGPFCSTEQVTVGEEGFFGPDDPNKSCNPGEPGSSWAAQSGQDFTNNHRSKDIDFTVHAHAAPMPYPWLVSI